MEIESKDIKESDKNFIECDSEEFDFELFGGTCCDLKTREVVFIDCDEGDYPLDSAYLNKHGLISMIDENNKIKSDFKDNDIAIRAYKSLNGIKIQSMDIVRATKIYKRTIQRIIIESLLMCEDCTVEEICSLTGLNEDDIAMYKYIFFRIDDVFDSKIDIVDYIESGISNAIEEDDKDMIESFLMKRWALSLGKEFVAWRYKLNPASYAPARMYETVIKEAFFYHKEKSMGKNDVTLTEYLRSANSLLSGIKNSSSIKDESKEDTGYDILEQLDIIIKDKDPSMDTIEEIDEEFINNALEQER